MLELYKLKIDIIESRTKSFDCLTFMEREFFSVNVRNILKDKILKKYMSFT